MIRLLASASVLPLLALFVIAVSLIAVSPTRTAFGDESKTAEQLKFFAEKVEPIFVQHCYQCHGNGKNKGGLNFYTQDALFKGGDSGPGVDLDDPDNSPLLDAVHFRTYEMPPSGKLSDEKLAIIEQWVKLGAVIPPRHDVIEVHDGVPAVNEENKRHWAFQPVRKPEVPSLDSDWVRNPVDAFILDKLQKNGLQPNSPADKRTLIRRLTYDLTGLPPTFEQVEAFLADDRPDAYEQLVESLLASPHYGEHWARYWLDLVRYAESNSFERDNPKPFVWKYRDYVIQAMNQDKPYDQFLLQQLAGDELPNATAEDIIATGFYRLGPWDDEPADPQLARYDELDDIVGTIGQGFLGLTLNCARCHDHKLDPIPITDYYSFVAFFQGTQRYGIRSDSSVYERSVCDVASPEEKQQFAGELQKYHGQVAELRAHLNQLEDRVQPLLPGGVRDDFKNDSARQRILKDQIGKHLSQQEFDEYAKRRGQWHRLKSHPPQSAAQALCITEVGTESPATFVLIRGNPGAEGDRVEPAFPQILSPPQPQIVPTENGKSSGRRLALAKWIISPENPLTARVMVNRIWQWHFDEALVRTPSNFGLTAEAPVQPELLDWLAAEFVERGWSIKEMHRQILLSNTYRMSSTGNSAALAKDPLNTLLWRVPMRRLRAEEIRDSVLMINNTLKLNEMFGPSIYPQLPAAILAGQSMPGHNWPTTPKDKSPRRSIYIHVKRSLQVPLLASFDVAETDFTCPVRFATTQPTQALGMLNSEFMNEQAVLFADDVKQKAGPNLADQVAYALLRATQRQPTNDEIAKGIELITRLQEDHGQSPEIALKSFCLIALNLNETIYLD
ncbi:MAG TPA: PSD1 and planctomycete cytochrome C domain-containing protein [Planctomicrobium sp.]|nr:PSD1 and planctomycete cytochrome C domain-containing protein [Planctomicrobium sp.]